METAEEIVKHMKSLKELKDADLSYITDEFVKKLKTAKPINQKLHSKDEDDPPTSMVTYTGNHPTITKTQWTWQDTPGKQCGQTRNWQHSPIRQGEFYSQSGNCSTGSPWFSFTVFK